MSIFIAQSSCNVSTGEMLGRARVKAHTQIRLPLIRQMWLTWWQLNLAHEGPRRLPAPILRHSAARGEQNHHSCCDIDHCSWRVWKGLQLGKIHLKNIYKMWLPILGRVNLNRFRGENEATLLRVCRAAVAAVSDGSALARSFSHSFCLTDTSAWMTATCTKEQEPTKSKTKVI